MPAPLVSSLIAAVVALLVSWLTLWVAGKREDRKWIRDQALAQLNGFIRGSFDGHIQEAWGARRGSACSGTDVSAFKERDDELDRKKLEALTLLRLTASWDEIVTAERLFRYERLFRGFAYTAEPGSEGAEEKYQSAKRLQNEMRDDFLNAARKGLSLPPGPPLNNRYPHGSGSPDGLSFDPESIEDDPEWSPFRRPSRIRRASKRVFGRN